MMYGITNSSWIKWVAFYAAVFGVAIFMMVIPTFAQAGGDGGGGGGGSDVSPCSCYGNYGIDASCGNHVSSMSGAHMSGPSGPSDPGGGGPDGPWQPPQPPTPDTPVPPQVVDVCSNIVGVQVSIPAGYSLQNRQCVSGGDVCPNLFGVQTATPSGYSIQNGQCVSSECSPGYTSRNGQCVLECPAGFAAYGGQCVAQCPAGYALINGQCTQSACSQGYYCSDDSLYVRNAQCGSSLIQTCTFGCAGTSCIDPFVIATLTAKPVLVRQGDTTEVTWRLDTAREASCTVAGTNGDSWSGKSGTKTSSAIEGETTYTLSCNGQDLKSATVRVIPSWQER